MHYGVVDADNRLVHYIDVPLPGPRLPHDMAFTENYVILNDFPMFWDPELLQARRSRSRRFHRDMPSRFAVIPRRGGTDDIRWFEADPTYVLHFTNAYEDGDEIVLDGFFQGEPCPPSTLAGDKWQKAVPLPGAGPAADPAAPLALQPRHRRDDAKSSCRDSITEFGMINSGYAGRDLPLHYAATGKPGWFLFDGLVKHDLETGAEQRFAFDDGVYGSETAMAPRVGSTGRGRRLPGHAHHRHERRRLVLPGVRRRPGRRRAGVQAGAARTGLQRNPLDLGHWV